jgi:hypothetical protein
LVEVVLESPKESAARTGRYHTRCQKIGEVNCLFVSWYKDGKFPLINVGPSKGPMVFLNLFALFCMGYLLVLVQMFWKINKIAGLISYGSIFANLILYLMCLLRDPGINESIFLHYIKICYGSKPHEESSALEVPETNQLTINSAINDGDIESVTENNAELVASLQQRGPRTD